jgi:hypothetical protein
MTVVPASPDDQATAAHPDVGVVAELRAAYGAVASTLARDGAPPLVTAARVAGLGVPGALIEVSAVAAVIRE